jgi:hypothetical protein
MAEGSGRLGCGEGVKKGGEEEKKRRSEEVKK